MPQQQQPIATGRISYQEFLEKYASLLADDDLGIGQPGNLRALASGNLGRSSRPPTKTNRLLDELKGVCTVRALRAAAVEDCPEAFKMLLLRFLLRLNVWPPDDVFTAGPKGRKPGRPVSSQTAQVYSTWTRMGEPSLYRNQLAQAVYREKFTQASGIDRRKLRDRCRRAVERQAERLTAKLDQELANARRELAKVGREKAELLERIALADRQLAELKARQP